MFSGVQQTIKIKYKNKVFLGIFGTNSKNLSMTTPHGSTKSLWIHTNRLSKLCRYSRRYNNCVHIYMNAY